MRVRVVVPVAGSHRWMVLVSAGGGQGVAVGGEGDVGVAGEDEGVSPACDLKERPL